MPALETDSDDGYSVETTLVQQQPVDLHLLTAARVISPDSAAVGSASTYCLYLDDLITVSIDDSDIQHLSGPISAQITAATQEESHENSSNARDSSNSHPRSSMSDNTTQPLLNSIQNFTHSLHDQNAPNVSGSTFSSTLLQSDPVLCSGDRYVITFRGCARYLTHNNFQYYTNNVNLDLQGIKSLIARILVDSQASTLVVYSARCPSVTMLLQDSQMKLPHLSHLCLSLDERAVHIDVETNAGQTLMLGRLTAEKVGAMPSINARRHDAYYSPPLWFQDVQIIGIPPSFVSSHVSTDSYYRVIFTRHTEVRVHDQIQHFSSTSTVSDIQTWLSEHLGTSYAEPMVYPETQLHFLHNNPVPPLTNISDIVSTHATVSLHVLSKSPLLHTDASEVTRIFFGHYVIQHCINSVNGREQPPLFDRREQTDDSAVRISQTDIHTTVPFRLRTQGFDTDRPNFHGYVIRFYTVLPESHPSWPRYSSFEYLEFDNRRGFRHIRWLISQNTAISTSNIHLYCPNQPRFRAQVTMSNTLGDLCDLFGSTRDRHVSVIAEPRRGVHHPLGYLTVERVGTLRPQLQPPYLSGAV
jgi:hypothetical protein